MTPITCLAALGLALAPSLGVQPDVRIWVSPPSESPFPAGEVQSPYRQSPPGDDPPAIAPSESSPGPAESLHAVRIRGPGPRLDGQLTDREWGDAEVAGGFLQSEPSPDEPATEDTEVRVLLSGDALYIGARLFDTDPQGIHGPLARRDEEIPSDWFYVYLDPNRDRSTAVGFGVNPRGVKRDFLIDELGREDPDWQAVWDVAVSVDSLGWAVEMRIPLSQLRFGGSPSGGGSLHWGANFERHLSRRGEVSSWAPIPRNRRQFASSLADLTGMEDIRSPLRLEVLPYSLARVTHPGHAPNEVGSVFGTVGADMKLGVTPTLTLSGAFNPDFGQVEADPAVVNVSGYRTFFPEKRPFFLEDQEFFNHQVGRTRLFHSRRIGRDVEPTGRTRSSLQRVPDASGILAASKLSGRTDGGWSLGVLHAVTNSEVLVTTDSVGVETFDPVEPRTNYVVARVGREYREGRESLGGIFTLTHRGLTGDLSDDLVSRAVVGGGIWSRRSRGGTYALSGSFLGSQVQGESGVIRSLQNAHGRYLQRPDASHLRFDPERTSLSGVAGDLSLNRAGSGNWSWGVGGEFLSPGFEVNDLGYQRESDVAHQFAQLGYDRLGEGILLRRRRLILTQWSDWTLGRERTGTGGRADLQFQFRNLWGTVLQLERHLPHLAPDQLRGGPALRMPGSTRQRVILYSDPRRSLTLRLDGSQMVEDETGGVLRVLRGTLGARPAGVAHFTLEPSLVDRVGAVEYLTRRSTTSGDSYVFGRVDQRTLSLVSRLDLALSPTFSLQLYAQPYLVTRRVGEFRELVEPRGATMEDRFQRFTPEQVRHETEEERIYVDRSGDGEVDFSFPDPAFTYGQLSSNLVLRWEYRPASTLYVVWSHDFRDRASSGSLAPAEGLADLFGVGGRRESPATNVLLIKLTYWLSP
jgi:hypothetical protein